MALLVLAVLLAAVTAIFLIPGPQKRLVWFESSSHMPNTEEKDKFNEFMSTVVLPALIERERVREASTGNRALSGGHAA